MTKENLIPFIETDILNFWRESINPINEDSTFLQHGIDTLEAINANFDTPGSLWLINTFLKMNYFVKGEYFLRYTANIILTNRRLFIWFSDIKKIIPLSNLIRYDEEKNGCVIEYNENGALQKMLITKWLDAIPVNNALNKYRDVKLAPEEITLLSNKKPTLDSLYNLSDLIPNYEEMKSKGKVKPVIKQTNPDTPVAKTPKNYSSLIKLCLFLLLMGGCAYWLTRPNPPVNLVKDTRVGYDSITGKKMKKCPWCGGIGRVGYAGESKAQCERTGMGLGNYCTTCGGTGYVKDDDTN